MSVRYKREVYPAVSPGHELVPVHSMQGKTVETAHAYIGDDGFVVRVEHADAAVACAIAAAETAEAARRAGDGSVAVIFVEVDDTERAPCDQDGGF